MPKEFFITTAIDYTNSAPHIGHAYEKVLADVIARYHRLKGDKVFFLTGVDQHGQKVRQSAAKEGLEPPEFVKGITQKFVDLWKKLDVKYDEWAETTADRHKKVVQGMLERLFNEGQIYKDKQAGYYSVRQEQFLTDKERGPDGEFGPEWGEVEFREEENYYFKLGQHKEWLLRYLDPAGAGQDAVIPDFRQTELRNAVERLSGDLCISRPKSRLDWGIELPFDKDFVTYVWFDALTNYISFAGYDPKIDKYEKQSQEFRERWPALQIIGKDILIPAHGIYWLIMLHAIGFPDDQMPQLLVHGWWNISGTKMSKSAGNIVDPDLLVEQYGPDAVRYYLMNNIVTGKDADFDQLQMSLAHNSALAGIIGNLVHRTLNMAAKYRDRILCHVPATDLADGVGTQEMKVLVDLEAKNAVKLYTEEMSTFHVDAAFKISASLAVYCNWLVERTSPWVLAKNVAEKDRLDAVLYHLAETSRIVAILISPVVPRGAHGIFDQLNWKTELSGKEKRFRLEDAKWGGLPDGHTVGKPTPLFPRIEL